MSLVITTAPETEPVTVSELKTWGRISTTSEDTLLGELIEAARIEAENLANLALITQVITETLDCWPRGDTIELERGPVESLDSLQYLAEDGGLVEFKTSVTAEVTGRPARLVLKDTLTWPILKSGVPGRVVITYTAGYADANAVPQNIRLAIRFLALYWYQNREMQGVVPDAFGKIVLPYKVRRRGYS